MALFGAMACSMLLSPQLQGQNPITPAVSSTKTAAATAAPPSFDVVSIKPNKTGSGSVHINQNDGNFDASNVSIKMMILSAYELKESQLIGLPKWAESDRFDIKAKVVDPDPVAMKHLTQQQSRKMLEPILTDRFQLKFHHEMKPLPVFDMVVGKGGAKFKETTNAETVSEDGVNGVRAGGISVHNTQLIATGVPLSALAAQLSRQLNRIVIDKTGLSGKYNLSLTWTPDEAPTSQDTAAPTLFTALSEQLGLKLQAGKAEVEMFIVDQVELPADN